jgi:hypothetical protein
MIIERVKVGARMSQAVIHADSVVNQEILVPLAITYAVLFSMITWVATSLSQRFRR